MIEEKNVNWKKIDEKGNYLIEKQIETNWWVRSTKMFVQCIGNVLVLVSVITGCISISEFVSLIGFPIRITCSAIGLKFFTIASGIKNYKSIIKKKKKSW